MAASSILLLLYNINLWLLFIFLVFLLYSYLAHHKKNELSHLPGPAPLPILGNALLISGGTLDSYLSSLKMLKEKYGPVARFSFGTLPGVFIFGPKEFEKILSNSRHITKGYRMKFAQPWLGHGLLTSTGEHWKTHRKLLTPTFHFRILEDFLHVVNDQTNILCTKLKTLAGEEHVNVYPLITHCTLDIICETAMGTKIHCQEDNSHPYVKAIDDCQNLVIQRMRSPWLWNNLIFSFTPCGRNMSKCLDTIHGFTQKVIKERKAAINKEPDNIDKSEVDDIGKKPRLSFLDLLLTSAREGNGLTDQDIRDEVDTFMFAGHDTTASNISLTLYLLAYHKEAQSKCQQELELIFNNSERPPTSGDLKEMKYLHSCIKETLRLYSSVPGIQRTTGEPVELGGYLVPANTEIMLNITMLHRDPQSFPHPDKFLPERFLAENESGRHPYAYVPFSAGPRNCIGQKFAMMEEKAIISTILRKFRLHTRVALEEVPLVPAVVLKPKDGLFVELKPRMT